MLNDVEIMILPVITGKEIEIDVGRHSILINVK
jgi:hypothetical protein